MIARVSPSVQVLQVKRSLSRAVMSNFAAPSEGDEEDEAKND